MDNNNWHEIHCEDFDFISIVKTSYSKIPKNQITNCLGGNLILYKTASDLLLYNLVIEINNLMLDSYGKALKAEDLNQAADIAVNNMWNVMKIVNKIVEKIPTKRDLDKYISTLNNYSLSYMLRDPAVMKYITLDLLIFANIHINKEQAETLIIEKPYITETVPETKRNRLLDVIDLLNKYPGKLTKYNSETEAMDSMAVEYKIQYYDIESLIFISLNRSLALVPIAIIQNGLCVENEKGSRQVFLHTIYGFFDYSNLNSYFPFDIEYTILFQIEKRSKKLVVTSSKKSKYYMNFNYNKNNLIDMYELDKAVNKYNESLKDNLKDMALTDDVEIWKKRCWELLFYKIWCIICLPIVQILKLARAIFRFVYDPRKGDFSIYEKIVFTAVAFLIVLKLPNKITLDEIYDMLWTL
ncbi:hypothetical protein NEQG_00324 [Nematocida parisii ERTm3]|uniref:Uncharacterized protein n=1 Tax=Nematocida parisii (strain ERTm3) TaxID=935791 RepID=I3EK07_NEMP3|nr:hypothetical protein NEQG_00324 [Nematocida parisii ERTm3]